MEIELRYLIPLNSITGVKREKIQILEGITIEDLMDLLVNKYGKRFKNNICSRSKTVLGRYLVNFSKNGTLSKAEEILYDQDQLPIFKELCGG